MTYRQEAIPLLIFSEHTQKYEITQQASKIIMSIQTPISIISVAGLYRTGKSYFLNRILLNRSNGFGVGPTINPCTKGLWMWGTPIKTSGQNGQPMTLIIIDTQGLGALDEDQNHDTKIFSLAILLSTSFIYNSVGSIDQNAIQSLNLVLNLTENIRRKSMQSQGSINFKEMPSFTWIVRDFSLQLVDELGRSISPKQYLQNALALSKGSSKQTEQKNKIRKFICECFSNRDCFTLIKPLIDEQKLQILDKIPFQSLRSQFIKEVINIRKKIMSRLKPKFINNVQLNGQSYISLMKNYVEAINQGAVPNIQNAWQYLCAQRNIKIISECQTMFQAGIKELASKLPYIEVQLRQMINKIKKNTVQYLKNNIYGQKFQQLKQELIRKFQTKEVTLIMQNQKDSLSVAQSTINREYQLINKKLTTGVYKKFSEFEVDVNSFYIYLMQNHRKYQNCQIVYLEFLNKRLIDASRYFSKIWQHQTESLKNSKQQIQTKLEKQLSDLRNDFIKQTCSKNQYINKLQREKIQEKIRIQELSNQLKESSQINQQVENHYKVRVQKLNISIQQLNKQLKSKEKFLDEKIRELDKIEYQKKNQWEKEKALWLQQQKFLNQKLLTYQKKQRHFQNNLYTTKSQFEAKLRQLQNKNQLKMKQVSSEILEKSERIVQLTDINKQLMQQMRNLEKNNQRKQKNMKQEIMQLEKTLQTYKTSNNQQKNKLMLESVNEKKNLLLTLDQEKQKIRMYQIQIKEMTDQLKLSKSNLEKQKAIYTQKIQFQDIQIQQLKQKYQQVQNTYLETITNYEALSKDKMQQALNALAMDMKNSHEKQLKLVEQQLQAKVKILKDELQINRKKKQQQEFIHQLELKRHEQKQNEYKQSIKNVQELNEKLLHDKQITQKGIAEYNKQIQTHYSIKIKHLQNELQEIRDKNRLQINEIQKKSEEDINVLKNYYEIQKKNLERRIIQQKDKCEKKMKKFAIQTQNKFNQQKMVLEQENSILRQNINQLQAATNKKISHMQYQFDIINQKNINQLNQKKIQFAKQIALSGQRLDFTNRKIQDLQKQKQSIITKYEDKIKSIKQQMTEQKKEAVDRITEEKSVVQGKNEKLKKINKDQEAKINKLQLDYERQNSSLKQKISNLQTKLIQQEENTRKMIQMQEQKLTKIQQNHANQINTFHKEIQKFKNFNLKLQEEKNQIITKLQGDKTMKQNKINFLDSQKNRYREDYEDILQKFETTVKHLSKQRQSLQAEKTDIANQLSNALNNKHEKEKETIRNQYAKIIKNLQEKVSKLENEKKMLNDKILSLEVKLTNYGTNIYNNSEMVQRKHQKQIDKLKNQYQLKVNEYQNLIQTERRQHKKIAEKLENRLYQYEKKRTQNMNQQHNTSKWNINKEPVNLYQKFNFKEILSTNNNTINSKYTKQSDTKKSRLSQIPQPSPNIPSINSNTYLLQKKPTKQRFVDLSQHGDKNRPNRQ